MKQNKTEKKSLGDHYSDEYFDGWAEDSFKSAKGLLEILYKLYSAQSVADFGCGRGAWLTTCEMLGSRVLHGYDGPWVKKEKLYSNNIEFFPVNFEEKVVPRRRYDLAISVEVAEHISDKNADNFINMMNDASDVIIFGAAAKGQGGENHINEHWQSYWIGKFKKKGYICFDIFRSVLWKNSDVDWWYKQNTFLFVKENTLSGDFSMGKLRSMESVIYDIVHPDSFEYRLNLFNVQREDVYIRLEEKSKELEFEIAQMKMSKFWRLREQYLKIKNYVSKI